MKTLTVFITTICLLHFSSPVPVVASELVQGEFQHDSENEDTLSKTWEIQTTGEATYNTEDALSMLNLIAVSFFIATLWRYKPMTKDMWIATSAGILLIASEIIALTITRDRINDAKYRHKLYSDGKKEGVQLETLQMQKMSYDDIEKLASIKWKIQAAASAAFFAAAGSAFYLHSKWVAARGQCGVALATTACAPAITAHESQRSLISDHGSSTKKMSQLNALQNSKLSSLKVCTASALAATPISSALVGSLTIAEKSCAQETVVQTGVTSSQNTPDEKILEAITAENPSSLGEVFTVLNEEEAPTMDTIKKLGAELFNLLIPSAHADFQLSMLGLGVVAIGVLVKLMKASWPLLDRSMAIPLHRGIAFTAAGLLAGATGATSKKLEKQMRENKLKIQELEEKMRIAIHDTGSVQGAVDNENYKGLVDANSKDSEIFKLSAVDGSFPCPVRLVKTGGGCESLEKGVTEGFEWEQFGGALKSSAMLGTQSADGIIGNTTLSEGTLDKIETLKNNAIATRNDLDGIKLFLNDQSKREGEAETNFAESVDKFAKDFSRANISTLEQEGMTPNEMISAWFGESPFPESPNNNLEAQIAEIAPESVLSPEPNIKNELTKEPTKREEFSYEFRDAGEVSVTSEASDGSMIVTLSDDYELDGDIVSNKDVSIFKVISNRYFLSGYPRLFDLKER